MVLCARSDKWVQVAQHDLTFARDLVNRKVRFGPDFMNEVIGDKVFAFGCNPRPSKLAGLDPEVIQQVTLYSDHHCNPWIETWADALWPCEGRFTPKWCRSNDEEHIASHLKIGPYFEALTAGLRTTDDPLERYNIMAVIVDRLGDKVLRDYPKSVVNVWVTGAASVFLEDVSPNEALQIGWLVEITPFGDNPALGGAFRAYLKRVPDATAEERRLLDEVARALAGEGMPIEARSLLKDRFGPRVSVAPDAPPPNRTDRSDIARLMKRVDTYCGMIRDEEYDDSWQLVAPEYREGTTRESYVRTKRSIWRRTKLFSCHVQRVSMIGDMAKVTAEIRCGEKASLFRKSDVVREETDFWMFVDGEWYNLVRWPTVWKETEAVQVPLAQYEH